MLIYWKIRYLNRTTKKFADRLLYLQSDSLDPVTKAAVELAAQATTQSDWWKFLRYRPLFTEESSLQTTEEQSKTPCGDFQTFLIPDYFEDENGQRLSADEMAKVLTGNPTAIDIPSGFKQHDIDLRVAEPRPVTFGDLPLSPEQLKVLACFRAYPRTVGDCPDFAQSSEQNGTVPLSQMVLG